MEFLPGRNGENLHLSAAVRRVFENIGVEGEGQLRAPVKGGLQIFKPDYILGWAWIKILNPITLRSN